MVVFIILVQLVQVERCKSVDVGDSVIYFLCLRAVLYSEVHTEDLKLGDLVFKGLYQFFFLFLKIDEIKCSCRHLYDLNRFCRE